MLSKNKEVSFIVKVNLWAIKKNLAIKSCFRKFGERSYVFAMIADAHKISQAQNTFSSKDI
jgi:hypothetical protein